MLLILTEYLQQYIHAFNVFNYLTFRAIFSALTALALSLLLGPYMIKKLSRRQIGQTIRELGPKTHLSKQGTPTMGGALIIVAVCLSTLLWSDLFNRYIWLVIAVTIAFGVIGWLDDYKKLVLKDSRGLAAKWKYLFQSIIALIVAVKDNPYP